MAFQIIRAIDRILSNEILSVDIPSMDRNARKDAMNIVGDIKNHVDLNNVYVLDDLILCVEQEERRAKKRHVVVTRDDLPDESVSMLIDRRPFIGEHDAQYLDFSNCVLRCPSERSWFECTVDGNFYQFCMVSEVEMRDGYCLGGVIFSLLNKTIIGPFIGFRFILDKMGVQSDETHMGKQHLLDDALFVFSSINNDRRLTPESRLDDILQWNNRGIYGVYPAYNYFYSQSAKMLQIISYALSLLNTKYVSAETELISEKRNRKHKSKTGNDLVEYKTLKLILPSETGRASSVHDIRELIHRKHHSVRGHFANYLTNPLFGKYQGVFWVPSHMRGNKELGEVKKRYDVKPRSKDDVDTP